MEMKDNEQIIRIDDRHFQLTSIDDVTVSFAEVEDPGLVDTILGMVIRGSVTQ